MMFNVFNIVASMDPSTGGPARSVKGLCCAVSNNGANVNVVVNNKEIKKEHDMQSNIECSQNIQKTSRIIYMHSAKDFQSVIRRQVENRFNNNIIHNHGIWMPINHLAAKISRNYRIPLITSPRGMLEPWAREHHRWKKKIAWQLYQKNDFCGTSVIHATSEQEAENIISLGLQRPIAIIPNGINFPEKNYDVCNKLSQKTALFLSRIHPKKGLLNLINAWSSLKPPGWNLVIAGPDENGYKKTIEREIHKNSLENEVKFIGNVSDKDKFLIYRASDLFILPTYSENFGIVVAEALSCGIPVITTKGTPWHDLEQYECGWWIDIGLDPLITALQDATSISDKERQDMGERGRKYVQRYNWETISQQMLEVYRWILGLESTPKCVICD